MPAVRLDDASYQLLSRRAGADDRPLARVLRSAVESYCITEVSILDMPEPDASVWVTRLLDDAKRHLASVELLQKLNDARKKGARSK